jgi:hypothetical protein
MKIDQRIGRPQDMANGMLDSDIFSVMDHKKMQINSVDQSS